MLLGRSIFAADLRGERLYFTFSCLAYETETIIGEIFTFTT